MTPKKQLDVFIGKYSPDIAKQARAAVKILRKRLPQAHVLVYDNYNALAIGFAPTERASDVILSVAVFPRWVSLFFLQAVASKLPDPDGMLRGKGSRVRHVVLDPPGLLEDARVQRLVDEALARAKVPLDPKQKGRLVIKSIAEKQRPRRAPD